MKKGTKPHYTKKEELRTILYNVIKINNSKYSAADICFLCDITGSMASYVKLIREILIDFLEYVRELICTRPRVSFIGYRDKDDKSQIETKEFTTDYESMIKYIEKIKCNGGDDQCEDIAKALESALKLDWSSDLNFVYLIADAPAHGRRYHNGKADDSHPDDDKSKLIEKLATHYRKSKMNLTILKCNNSVDTMIDIIRRYYESEANQLRVVEIEKGKLMKEDFAKQFAVTLSKDMTDVMLQSRMKNFKRIKGRAPTPQDDGIGEDIKFDVPFKGRTYTGNIPNLAFENRSYKYKLELSKSDLLTCKIDNREIGTGMFSKCFVLQIGDETQYVAKVPKRLITKPEELLADIEGTLLTKYFANKFNMILGKAERGESKKNYVKFTAIQVLSLLIVEKSSPEDLSANSAIKKRNIFLAQQFLKGDYVKFNNNYGWKNKDKNSSTLIAQAFSHFTYEYSWGYMMVTDIQGVEKKEGEIAITDPAIHSYVLKDRFGETNHGKIGMIRFFSTHECNDYCKKLQLKEFKPTEKIDGVKIECEEDKTVDHLYKDYAIDLDNWKKRIQSFDPSIDPDEDPTEEKEEEAAAG